MSKLYRSLTRGSIIKSRADSPDPRRKSISYTADYFVLINVTNNTYLSSIKHTLLELVTNMNGGDRLSIITNNEVRLQPHVVSQLKQSDFVEILENIHIHKYTQSDHNIGDSINLALSEIAPERRTVIIILTDEETSTTGLEIEGKNTSLDIIQIGGSTVEPYAVLCENLGYYSIILDLDIKVHLTLSFNRARN